MPSTTLSSGTVHRSTEQVHPLEHFIRNEIYARRDDFRTRDSAFSHEALMLGTARSMGIRHTTLAQGHTILRHKGRTIGGFDGRATTLVSHQAQRISFSLDLTREYLLTSGVAVGTSTSLNLTEFSEAQEFLQKAGSEVTVTAKHRHSQFTERIGIQTQRELRAIWQRESVAQSGLRPSEQGVHLIAHQAGLSLRLFVVQERVVSAIVRLPFFIVGDGYSTVGHLIAQELHRREGCSYLRSKPKIVMTGSPCDSGDSQTTIPELQELRVLSSSIDMETSGVLAVDITPQLSEDLKALAIDAVWAIPGLRAAGVDILAPSTSNATGAVVQSLLSQPDLTEFRYPSFGRATKPHRDILLDMVART